MRPTHLCGPILPRYLLQSAVLKADLDAAAKAAGADKAPNLSTPVLMYHGEDDCVVSFRYASDSHNVLKQHGGLVASAVVH